MVPATAGYMVCTAGGQALGLPELSPVAFSSGVTVETSGQPQVRLAVEGEACELSTQLTVMKTRHPEANADSAPWGKNEKPSWPVSQHTRDSYAGQFHLQAGRAQVSSGPPQVTCIRKDAK